jgi:hypothetical protein
VIIEIDISNYVFGCVVVQYDKNYVIYLVVFISKKYVLVEYIYLIYDKKLKVDIYASEKYREFAE